MLCEDTWGQESLGRCGPCLEVPLSSRISLFQLPRTTVLTWQRTSELTASYLGREHPETAISPAVGFPEGKKTDFPALREWMTKPDAVLFMSVLFKIPRPA